MWSKIKSIFSGLSTVTQGTSKIWGIVTLLLALYGAFSTLMVRWYGSEYKTSQDRLQEVSVSLSEARLDHYNYTVQVGKSLDAVSEGEERKAKQQMETLSYEGKSGSAYIINDSDFRFYNKLSRDANQNIKESYSNP